MFISKFAEDFTRIIHKAHRCGGGVIERDMSSHAVVYFYLYSPFSNASSGGSHPFQMSSQSSQLLHQQQMLLMLTLDATGTTTTPDHQGMVSTGFGLCMEFHQVCCQMVKHSTALELPTKQENE